MGLPKRLEKVIKMDKLDVKGGITKGGKTDDPIARKVRAREEAGRIRHEASRLREEASRLREEASRLREEASRLREEAGRIRNEAVGRLGEKIRKKQSSDRRIGSAIGRKQSRIEEARARAREHSTGLGKIGGEHALIPTKKMLDEVLNVLIYGGIGSAMSRRLYGVGRGKEKELGGRVLEEGGGVGIGVFGEESRGIEIEGEEGIGRLLLEKGLKEVIEGEERGEVRVELERGIGLEFEKEKEESLSLRGKSLGLIEREGYRLKEEESLRERLEERLSEEGYREEENELEGLGGVKRLEEELKEGIRLFVPDGLEKVKERIEREEGLEGWEEELSVSLTPYGEEIVEVVVNSGI